MKLTEMPEVLVQLTQLQSLDLNYNQLTALPEWLGNLTQLQSLRLGGNQLMALPEWLGNLTQLRLLNLGGNQLMALPEWLGNLTQLRSLYLSDNPLMALPEWLGNLTQLHELNLGGNQLMALPEWLGNLTQLRSLYLSDNPLMALPEWLGNLTQLHELNLGGNQLMALPEWLGNLTQLRSLGLGGNQLTILPEWLGNLTQLQSLYLWSNQLTSLPGFVGKLSSLSEIHISNNKIEHIPGSLGNCSQLRVLILGGSVGGNLISDLPSSLAQLEDLEELKLDKNPLNPALRSAYKQGLDAVKAYLRSLAQAEPLYEAKLVLVGEGGVGKTTLLKALSGREPRKNEPTTHGVSIDIHALHLPHPEQEQVTIQFNGWDFGGQEVYRATHQFFFSPRSIYLLVWEPRLGVQQCQVEDWLKLIRLRVGDAARVIIVSTHARTGGRIARIDKPMFLRDYGSMIVDFIEVDSLEDDPATGEKYGVATLKTLIAQAAKDLEQMGMRFSTRWKAARDELIELGQSQPRVSYTEFYAVCTRHGLDATDTSTLAGLMHDLGYIVYYGSDERLKDDVVLQPEWLTKAIGFVLEDRATQERAGVLPDSHLEQVWLKHPFTDEPRYDPALYPFFLRLMEKYDVAYRLEDGTSSLVAQHVPQVRPALPWLPEEEPKPERRRLAIVCSMDETPPGLVPWMIVRTHDYAFEQHGQRLHWQKGMFLRNTRHGEAMLELRRGEFHLYTEAVWPEYFMNVLRQTLTKLINDNWPGLEGRYSFSVPCRQRINGDMCQGRFDINALRQFLDEGDDTIRCQVCRTRQSIVDLLFGFEDEEPREQLARLETKLDHGFADMQQGLEELHSRVANYVMAVLQAIASESKAGPRLFTMEPTGGNWHRPVSERYQIKLWCEAEGCQHSVYAESGKGTYEVEATREWVRQVAPYANFVAGVLKTLLPMVAPAVNACFGMGTIDSSGLKDHLRSDERGNRQTAAGYRAGRALAAPARDAQRGRALGSAGAPRAAA